MDSIIFSVMSANSSTRTNEKKDWMANAPSRVHPMEVKSSSSMPSHGMLCVVPDAPTPPNCPQRRVMTSVRNPEMLMTTIPTAKCPV